MDMSGGAPPARTVDCAHVIESLSFMLDTEAARITLIDQETRD